MSSGAFNIAVTGMQAQEKNLTVISNNIANSQTTAFKANTMTFQEVYVSHYGQYANGTHIQFGNGVTSAGVTTDWGTGSIASTGTESNIAITAEGFFLVEYNGSVYYTRAGDFTLTTNPGYDPTATTDPDDIQYVFMNSNGAILLGGSGVNADGTINNVGTTSYVGFETAPSSYSISSDGIVTAQPDTVTVKNAQIGLQRFNNPDSLERIDGGLYLPTSLTSFNTGSTTALSPTVPGENGSGTLLQGSLEESNVDLVTQFTSMITTQRAFQANAKVITTENELLQTTLGLIQ